MTGGFVEESKLPPNPAEEWIKGDALAGLLNLDKVDKFDGLLSSFQVHFTL